MSAPDSTAPTGTTALWVRMSRIWVRHDWPVYIAVAVLTIFATWMALDLWMMDWSIPLTYQGDSVLISAHIKTDIETGWYENQPLLGAPFGQVYHDWKSADNIHHLFAAFLGVFIKDFGVVMNMYFLLGFLFAGLTAVWFLRLVGVSRFIALALAVLYAIAPYHFIRGESHMWLSAYYPIPLALGVVYLIARGVPIWCRNKRFTNPVLGWLFSRATFTLIALALVASANSYYGFWIILFIALSGLGRLIYDRSWRRFLAAVVAGLWTVLVMLLNMLPDIVYSAINGTNTAAVGRLPVETELYALKLMQLILPQPNHRVPALSGLREFYDVTYPFTSEQPALGFVAAAGFVAALGFVLYAAFTWGARRHTTLVSEPIRALGVLSALILFGFLLGTFGGLSSLVSFFTSDLRGWNRISIILAMLALAITGIILDVVIRFVTRRINSRTMPQILTAGVSILVFLGGYLDQVAPIRVPDYAGVRTAFQQDAALVKAIEGAVPPGSSILQIPFRKFPETAPINGVADSEQLKPYLHSDTLRWSGGGIKGRPRSEWSGIAEQELTTPALVNAVTMAGFAGVLLDRKPLYPHQADQIDTALTDALGAPKYSSPDGRYRFYTTAPAAQQLDSQLSMEQRNEIGDWVVNPVLPTFEPNYSHGYSFFQTQRPYEPRLVLDNPRTTNVDVQISLDVAYRQGDATFQIHLPHGAILEFPVSAQTQPIQFTMSAPPGVTELPVTISSGPAPQRNVGGDSGPVEVSKLQATDLQLVALLSAIPGLEVTRPPTAERGYN